MGDYVEMARRFLADPSGSPRPETPIEPEPQAAAAVVLAGPDDPTRATANALLGRVGMRLMSLGGKMVVGLWSDLDSSEVRAALTVFPPDGTPPIRYLDGADIPMRYKERRVPGAPVPLDVLHSMEPNSAEPWKVRDQMLKQMGWRPKGIRWRG